MTRELNKVPAGWQKVNFEDMADLVTDRIDDPKESGLKDYIGLDHIDTDNIRIKRFGSTNDVEATKFLCKKGDIIFGKRNAYLRKVAVSDRAAVVSAHSMVLRSKDSKVISDFLPCFMQSSIFWKTAQAISEGSMSPTIKWKTLASQEFWIPSLPEQKKISEILWSIENNLEKTERLLAVTEIIKNGLLEHLLTKGIGHKKFKKTEIGEIPAQWTTYEFARAIEINPARKLTLNNEYTKIEMSDLQEWNPKVLDSRKALFKGGGSKFKNGDTLLARITPCLENGKTAFIDMLDDNELAFGSTEFIVLSGKKDLTLDKYVYYTCILSQFRLLAADSMIGTSGRQRVPKSFFDNLSIPLPPVSEQKIIVEILDTFSRTCATCRAIIQNTKNVKMKLTNSFLSGELLIPKEALK